MAACVSGRSLPYTLGVLARWKMAPVYCRAVLSHDQRITLDGAPAEPVDTEAKELAKKQLARLEARKTKKANPPKLAGVPPPAPPPAPSKPLRDRVRASLLRRHT
jgi:sRNA-binding protein